MLQSFSVHSPNHCYIHCPRLCLESSSAKSTEVHVKLLQNVYHRWSLWALKKIIITLLQYSLAYIANVSPYPQFSFIINKCQVLHITILDIPFYDGQDQSCLKLVSHHRILIILPYFSPQMHISKTELILLRTWITELDLRACCSERNASFSTQHLQQLLYKRKFSCIIVVIMT